MQMLRGLFGSQRKEAQQQVDVLAEALARAQQHPQDAGAHFEAGSIYYARGRIEDAVAELERTVELSPEHADANYLLGLAYAKLGRLDDARRALQAAGEKTDNPMLKGYVQQKLQQLSGQPVTPDTSNRHG